MKRLVCLSLSVILACLCFFGCTTEGGTQTDDPVTTVKSPTISEPASTEDEARTFFPLEEKASFSAWAVWVYDQPAQIWTSWNDSIAYQAIEERTNVHVDFITPTFGSESEHLNLLISSGDYPEVISAFSSYYGKGIPDAISEGIAIPVDDIVNNYMPNYLAKVDEFDILREITTDEGYMGAIYTLNHRRQYPWNGMGIRKDFLDTLGLDVPETYDELYDVLVAFRDELGLPAPMNLDGMSMGGDFMNWLFSPGFGAIGTFFQKDGIAYYGPILEEYRDYLAMCAQWYKEGLIDRDFDTNNPLFGNGEVMALNDEVGYTIGCDNIGTYEENYGIPINPDYYLLPVPCMTLEKGQHTHFGVFQNYVEVDTVVTCNAKDHELIGRWFDFCYTEDAYYIMNYGIEDVTFYFDENNEATLCKEWCEDYFDTDFFNVQRGFTCIRMPFIRDIYMGRDCHKTDAAQRITYFESGPVWAQDDGEWLYPATATLTAEETALYSSIYNDVNTLKVETFTAIIKGQKDISEWDNFVETAKSIRVDEMIAIKQASLDRYYDRISE